ncbi:MAG TPA: STM3941 family protein [Pyrinomonadaceae bacterium]|jgi:hypothetical protein|nr:STM3941 family protein [Pyrinomonadaceae bacterium]
MNETIEIPLNKIKIILTLIGAVIFIIFGFLFIKNPASFVTTFIRTPEMVRIVGIAAVLVFGLCAVFIAIKLFDKKVGLRIDENGITDNSSATSIGLIDWADIQGIQPIQIASTKMLLVMTNDPEKYVDRAKNAVSKYALKSNLKYYGTPISVFPNSLKIKFDDLEKLLKNEFRKRKQ